MLRLLLVAAAILTACQTKQGKGIDVVAESESAADFDLPISGYWCDIKGLAPLQDYYFHIVPVQADRYEKRLVFIHDGEVFDDTTPDILNRRGRAYHTDNEYNEIHTLQPDGSLKVDWDHEALTGSPDKMETTYIRLENNTFPTECGERLDPFSEYNNK